MSGPRVDSFLDALARERLAFVEAVVAIPDPSVKVVETWDVRDLVVHCGFWSDHGADALELALAGRGAEFDFDGSRTDALNAVTIAENRDTSIEAAREREASAYERFRRALAALGDERLDERLGNGDSVEEVVRYDGPDHYAEHAGHLRDAAP
jgi:hypothetical protein